jgi:hypothetical protein
MQHPRAPQAVVLGLAVACKLRCTCAHMARRHSADQDHASNAPSYLFTFLTTFILLLVISLTLFLRALILRRRYRQSIEASILRNGGQMPPGGFAEMWRTGMIWEELERTPGGLGGSRRREKKDYGPVPVLWEAELKHQEGPEGEERWLEDMQVNSNDHPHVENHRVTC